MNILVDYHHPQLLKSLLMLFRDRLGATVFVPGGKDWWDQGYYNYYDNEAQSLDFLSSDLPEAISLKAAKHIKFDYLVSTIPLKESCFLKYLYERQPQAKHVVVLGNVGYMPKCHNLITSTYWGGYLDQHVVRFHQEFDTQLFSPPTQPKQIITSLMHHHPGMRDYQIFQDVKRLMPGWEVRSYGFNCPDGVLLSEEQVAEKMRESSFIWHPKDTGEGYGHVIHTAAHMGIPMIFRGSYMASSIASKYLIHDETGIDLDKVGSASDLPDIIKFYSSPEQLKRMGDNLMRIFHENVNFEREADDVSKFLKEAL